MPDIRISHAPVVALGTVNPDLRATQVPVLVLGTVAPAFRISQGPTLVIGSVSPPFSVTQAPVLVLASAGECSSRWAQIWTITRKDGTAKRFTSLDRNLVWGGETYKACDSMVPSASEGVSKVGTAGTMDLSGAIGAGGIEELHLFAGLYDGAVCEAWLVPWDGPGSPRLLLRGTFGNVEQDATGFRVELVGDGQRLQQTPLVETLQPGCKWLFGDEGCKKDLAPLTVTGTVDSADGQRVFIDAARTEDAGYFSRGRVTITSGANAGIKAEIKDHAAGGVFTLWPRLAFPLVPGVTYSMTPGCTNLKESALGTNGCDDWANYVNYGGFRHVPGRDKRNAGADVHED